MVGFVHGGSIVFLDVVVVLWFGFGGSRAMIGAEGSLNEGDPRRSVKARRPGRCLVLLILEGSARMEVVESQRQQI